MTCIAVAPRPPAAQILSKTVPVFLLRAAIVFVALVAVTHGDILGFVDTAITFVLGPLQAAFVSAVGLTTYPLQGGVLFRVVLALALAVVWGAIDQGRTMGDDLAELLLVEVRFVLAAAVLASGLAKILHVQLPWPTPPDWIRPIREMPSMYYVRIWTGASFTHELVLGLAELAAGIALLFRRTVTLGAITALFVVGNAVVIAIGFDDLRVGTYWPLTEIAALALLLVVVDWNRIWAAFAREAAPTPPANLSHSWHSEWLREANRFAKPVFLGVVVLVNIATLIRAYDNLHHSLLRGVYRVEEFTIDGRSHSADIGGERWRVVAIDDCQRFAVRTVNERQLEGLFVNSPMSSLSYHRECAARHADPNGTITLKRADLTSLGLVDGSLQGELRYVRTDSTMLELNGNISGARIAAKLRRIRDSVFKVTRYPAPHSQ